MEKAKNLFTGLNASFGKNRQSIFRQRWRHIKRDGDTLPLVLSVVVGLITGLGAYIFIKVLDHFGEFVTGLREDYGTIGGLIGMAIAGIVLGLIIDNFAREAKGHGVPEVMEAIALKRGRIRPQVAIAKIIASTITIGSGGSAGREGPISPDKFENMLT